jgi:hypothetical protein
VISMDEDAELPKDAHLQREITFRLPRAISSLRNPFANHLFRLCKGLLIITIVNKEKREEFFAIFSGRGRHTHTLSPSSIKMMRILGKKGSPHDNMMIMGLSHGSGYIHSSDLE